MRGQGSERKGSHARAERESGRREGGEKTEGLERDEEGGAGREGKGIEAIAE